MKYSKYSAVVIGSGIAGLYSALKLEQQLNLPDGILLITKSELGESNSYYAQGGMVAVLKSNKNDSVSSHVADTIKAGAGLSELNTIKFISENSDKVVKDLKASSEQFFLNVSDYGNTSAASIPIALNDAITKQQIKNGDQIMLIGFGGGLTWGGCIVSI